MKIKIVPVKDIISLRNLPLTSMVCYLVFKGLHIKYGLGT